MAVSGLIMGFRRGGGCRFRIFLLRNTPKSIRSGMAENRRAGFEVRRSCSCALPGPAGRSPRSIAGVRALEMPVASAGALGAGRAPMNGCGGASREWKQKPRTQYIVAGSQKDGRKLQYFVVEWTSSTNGHRGQDRKVNGHRG